MEISTLSLDPKFRTTKTVAVGKVNPGTTQVTITPAARGSRPKKRFGLIGYALTDEVALPVNYGFGQSFPLSDKRGEREEAQEEEQQQLSAS